MPSKPFMSRMIVLVGTIIAVAPSIAGSSPAAGATFEPASCTEPTAGIVECVLPDVEALPEFTLTTLLTEAQAVDSDVSASTPMVITAFGAAGHGGYGAAAGSPGSHGEGGEAQMTTTLTGYELAYETPALYYYLGVQPPGTYSGIWKGGVGGLGGTSTIVSPDNLTSSATTLTLGCISNVSGSQYNESGCSSTNLVLDAGGGGGGGEGATCNGGFGGAGGTAISSTGGPAAGAGQDAGNGSCSGGHGGHGGNEGVGGGGGSGGDGVDNHAGGSGNNGAGGMGGSVHTSNGPSNSSAWSNVGYCLYQIGNSGEGSNTCPVAQSSPPEWGAGGEGEWRGSAQPVGGGGGGGGGWGGGGGGGGGGDSDPGGGGGGGGSFAAKSTTTASDMPSISNPDGDGEVVVTFDDSVSAIDATPDSQNAATQGPNQPSVGGHDLTNQGYWLASLSGEVHAYGGARNDGSMGGKPLNQPIVGLRSTPDGGGYWEVAADGGVFAFGDANFYGSMGGRRLNEPVVGMIENEAGTGYWLVAKDGGVFAFGAASFVGSLADRPLPASAVGIERDTDGGGYWIVTADGSVTPIGDAPALGSMSGVALAAPVVGLTATPSGGGYWLAAGDGGVFAFGDATYLGGQSRP